MHPLSGKEKKPVHISQHISLVIQAFIALVGLIIILVTQNYVGDSMIKILLVIIALVLISGFFGDSICYSLNNYIIARRYNKLAKEHFVIFAKIVDKFEYFTEDRIDNIHIVISDIKKVDDFSKINTIHIRSIQNYYMQYKKELNQFAGTKDSLISLARDFESVFSMYDTIYVGSPIEAMKNIGSDKIPSDHIESYEQAREKYVNFINDYRNFAHEANVDLKDGNKSNAFGDGYSIQEYFETPMKL